MGYAAPMTRLSLAASTISTVTLCGALNSRIRAYLGKQSAQQTKVPTADADDCSYRFFIGNGLIQGPVSAPLLL